MECLRREIVKLIKEAQQEAEEPIEMWQEAGEASGSITADQARAPGADAARRP